MKLQNWNGLRTFTILKLREVKKTIEIPLHDGSTQEVQVDQVDTCRGTDYPTANSTVIYLKGVDDGVRTPLSFDEVDKMLEG